MIEDTMLFKKVFGCLAGGSIGDNLGRPAEGWHYKDIDEKKGRLENPWESSDKTKGGDPNFEVGTDDTALTQILCHTYIKKGGPITVEDYAERWLAEMDPNKFFFCMKNTYELLKKGIPPRATGVFNIVTGSGLMAISPVGIYDACDPGRAYTDALDIASMFQRDLDMYIPGVIAAAIAEAFRPGATVDSVLDTAIRVAPDKPIVTFDQRPINNLKETLIKAVEIGGKYKDVFSAREGLYADLLQWEAIDPQEVFALAFGIFKASGGDTKAAIIGGANIGRDADTISSLNGQLCGALNGLDSIPKEWMEGLQKCRGFQDFKETAIKMTELVLKKSGLLQSQSKSLEQLSGC